MAADRESGIEATPVTEDDLTNLVGTFPGPADTAYAGAKYSLKIKIPVRYPFQPPEISFITRVWHPNVSSVTVRSRRCRTGRTCALWLTA